MNIKRNNFWSAAKTIAATLFFGLSIGNAQGVFITEITDPNTNSLATNGGRFVELYNNTDADIDLTGWALRRWTNEQIDPQPSDQVLSGSISAGGFYIITNIAEGFESIYGFAADLAIGSGGPADSNGDDDIALINLAGDVVDFYGEVNTSSGTDNTGTVWEFEDGPRGSGDWKRYDSATSAQLSAAHGVMAMPYVMPGNPDRTPDHWLPMGPNDGKAKCFPVRIAHRTVQ